MSRDDRSIDAQAAQRLRIAFDTAFAAAPPPVTRDRATFLAIQVGGDPFALPLASLLGLHVDRKIISIPTAAPTLLGIASFRGALTAVHDLRAILGYPARSEPRWLALVAGVPVPVGLAFEAFEGQAVAALELPAPIPPRDHDLAAGADGQAPWSALTRGLVHARGFVRPVIDVGAVLAAIASRSPARDQPKER